MVQKFKPGMGNPEQLDSHVQGKTYLTDNNSNLLMSNVGSQTMFQDLWFFLLPFWHWDFIFYRHFSFIHRYRSFYPFFITDHFYAETSFVDPYPERSGIFEQQRSGSLHHKKKDFSAGSFHFLWNELFWEL